MTRMTRCDGNVQERVSVCRGNEEKSGLDGKTTNQIIPQRQTCSESKLAAKPMRIVYAKMAVVDRLLLIDPPSFGSHFGNKYLLQCPNYFHSPSSLTRARHPYLMLLEAFAPHDTDETALTNIARFLPAPILRFALTAKGHQQ